MAEQTDSNFFTKKHQRLYRWSTWVNYFSWVVLVYFFIYAIIVILADVMTLVTNHVWSLGLLDINMFFSSVPRSLFLFIRGGLFWLILQSLVSILNMIMETDLNYRENQEGENYDG